ncbi:GGDEF domain-containing protein [Mycolicibacterium lacusdiani]|uniref:GGDEF domain-containing protein n=1 Tax=Mycolicibacterium lacusdiani TaxID=2895283 RepID=UPI001F4829AC|nr:sensor domain-containing diguanylate cyclase [Mycolicibacterium lacusdiani]
MPVDDSASSSAGARDMDRLLTAVQELSFARTLADIERTVATSARELTGCDGATIVLRDGDMCNYADEDAISPLFKGSRFPMDSCIGGWAMVNRAAVVIADVYDDARIPMPLTVRRSSKSLVMVPIRSLDPVGAIGNYWADEREPSEREVALLQALADATSIAMENVHVYAELEQRVLDRTVELERANEKIQQLSVTDDLTGVGNRRGFYLAAEPALLEARRNGRDCVFGFIDVDGLKLVNDELGHAVGDALIADVARVLRATLHESDLLARMGGDEFAVLVTDSAADPAELQERLLAALQRFNDTTSRAYRISASFGLMRVCATDSGSVDELLARADELMYVEKRARLT